MILAAALGTYLPWLVLSGDRDQTFIWYLLPTIPFLCLALGFFAALAWERCSTRVAAGAYALVLVASFGFYLPLLVALPISPDAWRLHVPFRDCAGQSGPGRHDVHRRTASWVVLDLVLPTRPIRTVMRHFCGPATLAATDLWRGKTPPTDTW